MNDFSYPATKELNKTMPLYHDGYQADRTFQSEQSPLSPDPWAESTAPDPVSCDLQDVIICYQSQPDLLKLILLSKVEEDKRRAEEAKLRAKELDLLLLQHSFHSLSANAFSLDAMLHLSPDQRSMLSQLQGVGSHHNRRHSSDHNIHNTTATATNNSSMDLDDSRRDSTIGSSFDGSANSDELESSSSFSPIPATAMPSLLSMTTNYTQPMAGLGHPKHTITHPLSPPSYPHLGLDEPFQLDDVDPQQLLSPHPHPHSHTNSHTHPHTHQHQNSHSHQNQLPPPPPQSSSPTQSPCGESTAQRPRRRREMQAITKIVETREHPYVDGYFWKNNGNTIQKKTGNKSVYYKCSNSSKGCPVNKTVTWKDRGEYMIKYRGDHLVECNKVQRIVDM
ncbi:DNA-binding WRKY transcription factor [Phycomyces blakesleeanus]|uniref:DNA-binding WRKY transcription factor n=1 Tax=Phycomyces blakesleeanus TaxID=4837 RepID=A0ABR3BBU6_PHYBL